MLYENTSIMFFQKLWEKINSPLVNPCGIRKSHPRGMNILVRDMAILIPDQNIHPSGENSILIPHGLTQWI